MRFYNFLISFDSVNGYKVMSHYDASLYTARRLEMCNIVEATFVYLIDRPIVHSPYSDKPVMVSLISEYEFHGIFV